jgi:hypothetical protein
MKNQVMMTVTAFLTAVSAMASSPLRNGDYAGQTSDGRACGLRARPSEFFPGMTRIDFMWRKNGGGYEAGYVEVKDEAIKSTDNVLSAKYSNDITVAKVKVTLANDGSPLEAKMGLGALFKIGYDETCLELTSK